MRINILCSCVYFVTKILIMCTSTQYSNFGCMLIPNVAKFHNCHVFIFIGLFWIILYFIKIKCHFLNYSFYYDTIVFLWPKNWLCQMWQWHVINMRVSCLFEQPWMIHSKSTSISLSGGIDNLERLTLLLFRY